MEFLKAVRELFTEVWVCMWCSHPNPELELYCQKCGRKAD